MSASASSDSQRQDGLVRRWPRWVRVLLALGFGLLLGGIFAEVILRVLLFSDADWARSAGAPLRRANLYADGGSDADFYKLHRRWLPQTGQTRYANQDPKLGWVSDLVLQPEYGHRHRARLAGRRPVLMYGDSFTAGVIQRQYSWEALIAQTDFNDEVLAINYGVCAYGIDQIHLLFEQSIDAWVEEDPLVVIGILVEEDLDRAYLDFRGCPKPLYEVAGGELKVEYPGEFELEEWLREHPIGIRSYGLRYLAHHRGWLPKWFAPPTSTDAQVIEAKRSIAEALIRSFDRQLEEHGLDAFFVLYHGPRQAEVRQRNDWREPFLTELLDELELPWVSTRETLQAHHVDRVDRARAAAPDAHPGQGAGGSRLSQHYFIPAGRPFGKHHNRVGQMAALPALLRGLVGLYDGAVAQAETGIATPLPKWASRPDPEKLARMRKDGRVTPPRKRVPARGGGAAADAATGTASNAAEK